MAHRLGDRVLETFSTTGTGNITVLGAQTGHQALSAIMTSDGDTMDAVLFGGTQWEICRLTRISANVYSRGTPYASSTGAAISFSAGVKEVWGDHPALFSRHLNLAEISVASVAGTTDIGAIHGLFVEVTGTNAINHFGTTPNQWRFVRYAAATPHTHHANFICPGGASFTSVAGDTAIWKSDASGNWRCYAYFPTSAVGYTPQTLTSPQKGVALRNIGAAQSNLRNGKLVESRASSAATFAIKGLDGNDPSATNPVTYPLPDGTIAELTAACSVTIPSTATMGAANGVAFRLWFELIYDGGSHRLAVRNCLGSDGVKPFPGNGFDTSTAMGVASDTVGVTWSDVAVASAAPACLIGNAEYASGLATAGTWNVAPTRINLYVPGMAKPGDIVFKYRYEITVSESTSSATFQATSTSVSYASGLYNGLLLDARGFLNSSAAGTSGAYAGIHAAGVAVGAQSYTWSETGSVYVPACPSAFYTPRTVAAVTYQVRVRTASGSGTVAWGAGNPTCFDIMELCG